MDIEDQEQEILLEPELYAEVGDGVLTVQKNGEDLGTFSANQKTDTTINILVPTTTSELTNDANFQNANDLASAISVHNQSSSAHQDIRQAISTETENRVNADNSLQGQIDAITSASDVVDIVGTYAELQAYDTQHLKDNDVVKVLQDETHNDAMTYWRWSTSTHTWTYIGAEGPYYTKSETNTLLDEKLDASEVPDGFFDGPATITPTEGTSVEVNEAIKLKSVNLKGDSNQQTYTGANLFDASTITMPSEATLNADGSITVTYDNTAGTASHYTNLYPANLNLETSTEYAGFAEIIDIQGGGVLAIFSGASATSQFTNNRNFNLADYHAGDIIKTTDTTKADFTGTSTGTRTYVSVQAGLSLTLTFRMSVIADTSVTPETFVYQPFTGGVPSPNPSYPQAIETVTGLQTITFTDGDLATQAYTVDLGSIELCKIGTAQDYIYKSGDDWYIHKEIAKITLGNSSGETWTKSGQSTATTFVAGLGNLRDFVTITDENAVCMANSFVFDGTTLTADNRFILSGYQTDSFRFLLFRFSPTSSITDLTSFTTWVGSNNIVVYASGIDPTNTKISDQTLIGQLEDVLKASLYQPTTTISSAGNLPAIIGVEAFTEHLNSLLEIAAEQYPDQVTYTNFVGTDGVSDGAAGLVPAPETTDAGKFLKADGTWTNETTYSPFTGTDGNTGGTVGLVPAPATTDVGKFLKADGTWDTAGGGSTINVVQTEGTSQTDVMSQNATTSMVFADGASKTRVAIGINSSATKNYTVAIGDGSSASGSNGCMALGRGVTCSGNYSTAIGSSAKVTRSYSVALSGTVDTSNVTGAVALGYGSKATRTGEVNIGSSNTSQGYNSTNYRVIGGVHDGQDANDAVTVNQVNSVIDNINSALNTNIPHIGV